MPRRTEISPLTLLMRRVDAAADGEPSADTIPIGFPSVDKLLGGGFRRGDLIVLSGDVGSGKSALALAMALRAVEAGRRVAYFTGEMSVERVLERALAIDGRARIDALRGGTMDEATRAGVGAAAVRLRDRAPSFAPLSAGGVDAMAAELRKMRGLELVVVDSLQSLPAGGRTTDEELAAAVRELKRLALDLHVAMLATAHVPHLVRDRRDPRPGLDDLGAMGAVKQQADVVIGIFREEMYTAAQGVEGATELIVSKNRNGPTGYVDLYFYKQWMRFEDMLDPDR